MRGSPDDRVATLLLLCTGREPASPEPERDVLVAVHCVPSANANKLGDVSVQTQTARSIMVDSRVHRRGIRVPAHGIVLPRPGDLDRQSGEVCYRRCASRGSRSHPAGPWARQPHLKSPHVKLLVPDRKAAIDISEAFALTSTE
jgi:hypothetical protein